MNEFVVSEINLANNATNLKTVYIIIVFNHVGYNKD